MNWRLKMHAYFLRKRSLPSQAPFILFFEAQKAVAVVGGGLFEVLEDPREGFGVTGEPFADGLHKVSGRSRWNERLLFVLKNFDALIDMRNQRKNVWQVVQFLI